jgi:Bacterial membrane protein YfhO
VLRIGLVIVPANAVPSKLAPGLEADGRTAKIVRLKHQPSIPDAYLVGATQTQTHEQAIATLTGSMPFGLNTAAIVEAPCQACSALTSPGGAGAVQNEQWNQNSIDLHISATRPAMLVVSEAWFPGWTARIDGRSAPVVRTDGLVLGVPVPAGTHEVVLDYNAPGALGGAAISTFALAGFAVAFVVVRRRRGQR